MSAPKKGDRGIVAALVLGSLTVLAAAVGALIGGSEAPRTVASRAVEPRSDVLPLPPADARTTADAASVASAPQATDALSAETAEPSPAKRRWSPENETRGGAVLSDRPDRAPSASDSSLHPPAEVQAVVEPASAASAARTTDALSAETAEQSPAERRWSTENETRGGRELPISEIFTLREGHPSMIDGFKSVFTIGFRETLGSRHAEVTVSPPRGKPRRSPFRSSGGELEFSEGGSYFVLQIVSIDWGQRSAAARVRSASLSYLEEIR